MGSIRHNVLRDLKSGDSWNIAWTNVLIGAMFKFQLLLKYITEMFQIFQRFLLPRKGNVTVRLYGNVAFSKVNDGMELVQNSPNNSLAQTSIKQVHDKKNGESLAIVLCWLRSRREHVMKYSQFYLSQGFDVLTIQVTPWQLLWPQSGSKIVAGNILKFLEENDQYRRNVIHGFSVGGYLWGEVLDLMHQDRAKFQPVADRIVAQIWDSVSVMTFDKYKTRFPESVFPDRPILRKMMEGYVKLHTRAFYNVATRHYLNALEQFHSNNIVRCPALFFCSKDDPFLCVEDIQKAIYQWERNGIDVHLQAWDSSPHVSHLKYHPEEYQELLKNLLERFNLIPYPERFNLEETQNMRSRL